MIDANTSASPSEPTLDGGSARSAWQPELLLRHPDFAHAGDDVIADLQRAAIYKKLPAGLMTSVQGAQCHSFPVVLEGSARVFITGENGREITLYRLEPGGACVLAASSIMCDQPLAAYSVTETPGQILAIPAPVFRSWVDRDVFWRTFVFTLLSRCLASVIATTNQATFRRLDARIADLLLAAPADEKVVATTHQGIAAELGSSREVVSRVLKSFEIEGLVGLRRGAVELRDRAGLAERARQH